MEQIRWFWLLIFMVSLTWLGVQFAEFRQNVDTHRQLSYTQKNAQQEATINGSATASKGQNIVENPSKNAAATPSFDAEIAAIPNLDKTTIADSKQSDHKIRVETDNFIVHINTLGGTIDRAALKRYPVSLENKDIPTDILETGSYEIQMGLVAQEQERAPLHTNAVFVSDQNEYIMEPNKPLEVALKWQNQGVSITRYYLFEPNTYGIKVRTVVDNRSDSAWSALAYTQLVRKRPSDDSSSQFIYTYTGPAVYTPENGYQKISFDDIDDGDSDQHEALDRTVEGSWLGMLQHYFFAAIVPSATNSIKIQALKNETDKQYYLRAIQELSAGAGQQSSMEQVIAIGPTVQEELLKLHPELSYAVDYGVFHVIAAPLFWLLKQIYDIVGNWGVSIILVTVLIKLAFYKLSEKSYRSMANLRKLTPRIQQIRERYGDDKQAINKKMMEIYKKEKINPLGGCLPVLVQIPVFISLYWALIESAEIRQAPFALWIHDLSAADPYFVLPILMGISMFIQQKLNPAPTDPMQARIMQFLPFIFTVFFLFFPAGLVLYWVTNNILSITQQWYITKKIV